MTYPHPTRLTALSLAAVVTIFGCQATLSLHEARAAEPVEKIVAVVNDEAISEGDLNGRIKLAMLAGNYPDTPEVREKLTPQVLRALIDDQLRIQEAKRLKITVDKEEVDAELKSTAQSNNQTLDQFRETLTKEGVAFSTIERETMAQLSWRKVIQKEIRRRVEVTDDEIDAAYNKMMANIDKPQYLLAEIFLAVDKPADDERVKSFADQLEDQIRKGANFAKLAQEFSQGAGATQGGDMGAIQQGELEEDLDQEIRKMSPGQISAPIRTQGGYHILFLRAKGSALGGDQNEALVHLKNVLVPYTTTPTKDNIARIMADAEKVGAGLPNCAAIDEKGKRDGLAGDLGPAGKMTKVAELPRGIGAAVAGLQVNQMSAPVPTNDGIMMFMVCARKDPPKREPPTKEQVGSQLYLDRLDQQQQRYLSDLRSSGFVDVRV
jgi:peptidyl-prolyl cis-trans isomerase SurA